MRKNRVQIIAIALCFLLCGCNVNYSKGIEDTSSMSIYDTGYMETTQKERDKVTLDNHTWELHIGENKLLEVLEGAFSAELNQFIYVKLHPDCFRWESSDPEIVTVDEIGNISGVKPGNATITVYVGDAFDICAVTVLDNSVDFYTAKRQSKCPLFVKKGDRYYSLSSAQIYYGAYYQYWTDCGAGYTDNLEIPELEKDSALITFSNVDSYTCYKITKEITTFPVTVKKDSISRLPEAYVGTLSDKSIANFRNIETIDGKTPKEYLALKEIFHDFIVANEGETMTIGYYENTSYLEKTISANVKCFCWNGDNGSRYDLTVEKTKEGFFIVNTSVLEPGLYVIYYGSNFQSEFLLRVV